MQNSIACVKDVENLYTVEDKCSNDDLVGEGKLRINKGLCHNCVVINRQAVISL